MNLKSYTNGKVNLRFEIHSAEQKGFTDINIVANGPFWTGPCESGGSAGSGNVSGHGEYQARSSRVAWLYVG